MDKPNFKPEFLSILKNEGNNLAKEPIATYQANIPVDREDVRHTFVIRKDLLDKIRDYAYMQHLNGQFYYSQRDVLEEILDKFFQGKMLVPRPDFIRLKEQERVNKIKKGVKKK